MIGLAAALIAGAVHLLPLLGQDGRKGAGGKATITATEILVGTARVVAVNRADRSMVLRFQEGKVKEYKPGEGVKNFDQIKTGDKVNITLVEGTEIFVRKGDERPASQEKRSAVVTPKGAKPAIMPAQRSETAAFIEGVDKEKRTVTIRSIDGSMRIFPVGRDVALDQIKRGDEILVRSGGSLAVAVEKSSD